MTGSNAPPTEEEGEWVLNWDVTVDTHWQAMQRLWEHYSPDVRTWPKVCFMPCSTS